jgi:hypothetical protein
MSCLDAVVDFFAAIDRRDWDAALALMSGPFHLDYTSFGGGAPEDLEPDAVLARWRKVLPGFERTDHRLSGLDVAVDGDTATVDAQVVAIHTIGARVWTLTGAYRVSLRPSGDWKLSGIEFRYEAQSGSNELLDEARRRAVSDAPPGV